MKNIEKRKSELKHKIRTLEWDLKRNQIHYAKKTKLNEYKKELEELKQESKDDSEKKEV